MSKHSFRMGYVQMQIIKHALQYYIDRPNGTEHEKDQERSLLERLEKEIAEVKAKWGF